jgi:predicted PurR-regulated permease PerM
VGSGIGLLVVAVVAGSVDNIIKPLIVSSGSEESLNPVISLLAIIGAVIVYGIPGLLLGPILTELTLKIVPILFSEEEKESEESVAAGP